METYKEITRLRTISNRLGTLCESHAKETSKSSCDKHDLTFGGDSRFAVFSANIFLDCHYGYYGDSGCSSPFRVDSKDAERLLNKVLNRMRKEILAEMANEAAKEAAKLVSKAEKELSEMQQALDLVKSESPQ